MCFTAGADDSITTIGDSSMSALERLKQLRQGKAAGTELHDHSTSDWIGHEAEIIMPMHGAGGAQLPSCSTELAEVTERLSLAAPPAQAASQLTSSAACNTSAGAAKRAQQRVEAGSARHPQRAQQPLPARTGWDNGPTNEAGSCGS